MGEVSQILLNTCDSDCSRGEEKIDKCHLESTRNYDESANIAAEVHRNTTQCLKMRNLSPPSKLRNRITKMIWSNLYKFVAKKNATPYKSQLPNFFHNLQIKINDK